LIISARFDDVNGTDSGSVYIYKKNTSGVFEGSQKIVAPDGNTEYYFGESIAISGDASIILVGSINAEVGGVKSGAVYVFKKNIITDTYEFYKQLSSSDGEDEDMFGISCSIANDSELIAIGASYKDSTELNTGAVYIFKYNTASDEYEQIQKIVQPSSSAWDLFGQSIDLDGDGNTLVVSRHLDDTGTNNNGAVFVYKKNTSGVFEVYQTLTTDTVIENAYFGGSIRITNSGNTIVVSAGSPNTRLCYVFKTNEANGIYELVQKIDTTSGEFQLSYFDSVDISDNAIILISSTLDGEIANMAGAVFVYK
jgi:hypothetical protein